MQKFVRPRGKVIQFFINKFKFLFKEFLYMSFKPKLNDLPFSHELVLNPDLKYHRTQLKEKGIKWLWGFDEKADKYKLMYAHYPKLFFNKNDMKRIVQKYYTCPNCIFGKTKEQLNFMPEWGTIAIAAGVIITIIGLVKKFFFE